MELREKLEKMRRNGITLEISGNAEYKRGGTRFGGRPDVPCGFEWPAYEGEGMHGKTAKRPLSFVAQFDCTELAKYDAEHLLPERGVLSFFYEMDSMRWGYDPKDKGCARVYWFEDPAALEEAEFPEDLEEDYRFPALAVKMCAEPSLPGWEDFTEIYPEEAESSDEGDEFFTVRAELGEDDPDERSKLLGWADTIQWSMPFECELVTRGYYMGGEYSDIPQEALEDALKIAQDKWLPLFQLDTVEDGDFELMFGDCGRIYFYVTRDDLAARRFENVWLILQCY